MKGELPTGMPGYLGLVLAKPPGWIETAEPEKDWRTRALR